MRTVRVLSLLLALVPLSVAQLLDGGFPIVGFPEQCNITCQPLQETLVACPAVGDIGTLAKAHACICMHSVAAEVEQCGSCVLTSTIPTSHAALMVKHLAIAYTRACGVPLSINGSSSNVSSMLADGGASYSSERASLSSRFTTATASPSLATTGTVSSTMAGTLSSTAWVATGTTGPSTPTPTLASGAFRRSPFSSSAVFLAACVVSTMTFVFSSTPDRISSTGRISDRLAKLGLGHPTSDPSSSSPSPSNTPRQTSVSTGAVTKVSDKISRFQAQAEAKPLLPSGGSFGLAPAKARVSSSRDRFADEKPRVASLGGGRASVPLDVVTPRSVSAGNSPKSSDSGSTPCSRAASRQGSSREASMEEVRTPEQTTEESTPIPSPSHATSSALDSLRLPSGMRTPGAMSVSSMRVETGSVSSEGGPNPADIDVQAALAARDTTDSPLSSPVLAGIAIPASSGGSVSSVDGIAPSLPPPGHLRNPLDSLRIRSRPGSIRSVSSLSVEAPSEDVANISVMSINGSASTPTVELAELELGEAGDGSAHDEQGEHTPAEHDARELARQVKMRDELAQYEADERDPPALGPYQEDEPGASGGGDNGESKEPPFASEEEDETDRPETPKPGTKTPPSPTPVVKCSDCGEVVQLLELADHSCEPSKLPPALSSPSASPPAPKTAKLPTPIPLPRPTPDVPDVPEEPLEDLSLEPSPSRRAKERSSESGVDKLDAFVPQSEELVPEDVLDMYGYDEDEQGAPADAQVVPQDVADVPSDDLEPPVDDGETGGDSTPMTRSASTPSGAASRLRQSRSGSTKPRVQSAYGGPMPGRYYTSDDEDEGEPGSVTIVRSQSSSSSGLHKSQ